MPADDNESAKQDERKADLGLLLGSIWGGSPTARFYGISALDEARAYLAHPMLGPRLDLCTKIVLASESSSLHAIFGSPDDMKFRSCATLFSLATDDPDNPFRQALDRWCSGRPDERTLALIDSGG